MLLLYMLILLFYIFFYKIHNKTFSLKKNKQIAMTNL